MPDPGIDGELIALGMQIAGFHLEAGERDFVRVAWHLAEDIGRPPIELRRYLRAWYDGARDVLEDSGVELPGVWSPARVAEALTRIEHWGAERDAETDSEATPSTVQDLRELMGRALSLPTPDAIMAFVDFTSKMKRLGPYNMLMVYAQRPGASAVSSKNDWAAAGQTVRPDAIPILILRPKGPIAQVFELLDTLPSTPRDPRGDPFAAAGQFDPERLARLIAGLENPGRRKLRVEVSEADYGANLAGKISGTGLFRPGGSEAPLLSAVTPPPAEQAPLSRWRVRLNLRLEPAEKFATLLHELGHLFCGHLGPFDADNPAADEYGWPDRRDLPFAAKEIEAELVAWHMCEREGLVTGSPLYLKPHLCRAGDALREVDLDRVVRSIARIRAYIGDPQPPTPTSRGRAR